jgi:retron-type reverse transcriptase
MLLRHNIWKILKTNFPQEFTERHVCYTNATRKEINAIMMEKYAKKARKDKSHILQLKALDHSEESQDVSLTANTPLIGRKNVRKMDLFNNEMWIITKINKKD